MIEGSTENKNYSALKVDPKTVFETNPSLVGLSNWLHFVPGKGNRLAPAHRIAQQGSKKPK